MTSETETSLSSTQVSPGASNINPTGLPDLETICKKQIPTLRYIPVKFRLSWSDVLNKTIEGCISSQTAQKTGRSYLPIVNTYYEHLIGVERNKQNQESLLSKQFERWKEADYAGLWYEAASMKQSRKTVTETKEALAACARALCLQGQFERAAKILSSNGVAPDNMHTFRELKTPHPLEEEPRLPLQDYSSQAHQFDEPTVFNQIEAFPNLSADGSSKIYPELLLHAVNCAASDQPKQAITNITKLVNLASRGQLPVSVAPVFCSASLTALKKLKGGVRPTVMGELLQLLVAKCIAKQTHTESAELFSSKQLGVGVKGGAQSIIHATKITFEKLQLSQDAGILQIDFKNAFNSIKRSQILNSTIKLMPSLASFVIYCYSQQSHLYYSNKSVTSQSGVQQGDPFGPLLFSLTLWPIIEAEIESKRPNLTQHCWYLDDGIIAGTEPKLNEALDILNVSGKTCGLELRRDKCEVWSKGALKTIDSRMKRNSGEGLEIQGTAVGSPRFVASSIQKRVQKIEKILEDFECINDPQCALGILRSCPGAPKMVYSLRCNNIRGSYKYF